MYVSPLPDSAERDPEEISISPNTNPVIASLDVKVKVIVASFVVLPVLKDEPLTAAVIVIVGAVPSYVHANVLDTVLPVPPESVNAFAATATDVAPSPDGVNVAVYIVEETPVKAPNVPPETVMSDFTKLVVGSFDVKTYAIVPSFVVEPEVTPAVVVVIVMVGGVPS